MHQLNSAQLITSFEVWLSRWLSAVSYAVFYNLLLIAQTWVEKGVVKSIPGVWWPNLLLALLIVGLIWKWPQRAQQRLTTLVSQS